MTDTMYPIEPRMKNAAGLLPGSAEAIQALIASCRQGGVPETTLELLHLRTSQINGCSFCVDAGWRSGQKKDVALEKLFAVAAWREAPRPAPGVSDAVCYWGASPVVRSLQLGHGPTLSRWHADAINLSLDSPELSCGHAG